VLFGSNKYTGSAKSKGSPSGRLSGKILLVKSRPGEEEAGPDETIRGSQLLRLQSTRMETMSTTFLFTALGSFRESKRVCHDDNSKVLSVLLYGRIT